MDYFDLSINKGGLAKIFSNSNVKFCFFSFTSDWLFPTSETKTIIRSLNSSSAMVSFVEIKTDKGHDAFLFFSSSTVFFTILTYQLLSSSRHHFLKDKKYIAITIKNMTKRITLIGKYRKAWHSTQTYVKAPCKEPRKVSVEVS